MPSRYLDPDHRVVRYVPWAKLRKDEHDNVLGVLGIAFKLREDEEYLSATWAEFFAAQPNCEIAAIEAIRASRIEVKRRSGFAIGKVHDVSSTCLSDARKIRVRFVHEEMDGNPAHAALRNWPRDNDTLLELLAEDAWSRVILNKDVP